jgi:hypothetical protein
MWIWPQKHSHSTTHTHTYPISPSSATLRHLVVMRHSTPPTSIHCTYWMVDRRGSWPSNKGWWRINGCKLIYKVAHFLWCNTNHKLTTHLRSKGVIKDAILTNLRIVLQVMAEARCSESGECGNNYVGDGLQIITDWGYEEGNHAWSSSLRT